MQAIARMLVSDLSETGDEMRVRGLVDHHSTVIAEASGCTASVPGGPAGAQSQDQLGEGQVEATTRSESSEVCQIRSSTPAEADCADFRQRRRESEVEVPATSTPETVPHGGPSSSGEEAVESRNQAGAYAKARPPSLSAAAALSLRKKSQKVLLSERGNSSTDGGVRTASPKMLHEESPRLVSDDSPRLIPASGELRVASPTVLVEGSPRLMGDGFPKLLVCRVQKASPLMKAALFAKSDGISTAGMNSPVADMSGFSPLATMQKDSPPLSYGGAGGVLSRFELLSAR